MIRVFKAHFATFNTFFTKKIEVMANKTLSSQFKLENGAVHFYSVKELICIMCKQYCLNFATKCLHVV